MVLQVRDRLEGLATVWVRASERSDILGVGQHVVLQMLLLLE